MRYALEEKYNRFGPGIVGIFSATMGRYREFDLTKDSLLAPQGSLIKWAVGLNASYTFNNVIREMLDGDFQWLWMQGDDHVFKPDLLLKLLERDVDMVIPLCIRKEYPFFHVIHRPGEPTEEVPWGDFRGMERGILNGKTGLVNITGLTAGNGGLLVKRWVLEGMKDPWLETGKTHPEFYGADIYFTYKAQKETGCRFYVDCENVMGHILHMAVWPFFDKDGRLSADFRLAHDVYGKYMDPETHKQRIEAAGERVM